MNSNCDDCKHYNDKEQFCEILKRKGFTIQINCIYFLKRI